MTRADSAPDPGGDRLEAGLLHQSIGDVLAKGYVLSLGTADEDGPWVSDVLYVCDADWSVYWASSPQSRHSKAIERLGQAAATVTISTGPGQKDLGVQMAGPASRRGRDLGPGLVLKYLRKYRPGLSEVSTALIGGQDWYVLSPRYVVLVDQARYGFARQRVDLSDGKGPATSRTGSGPSPHQ